MSLFIDNPFPFLSVWFVSNEDQGSNSLTTQELFQRALEKANKGHLSKDDFLNQCMDALHLPISKCTFKLLPEERSLIEQTIHEFEESANHYKGECLPIALKLQFRTQCAEQLKTEWSQHAASAFHSAASLHNSTAQIQAAQEWTQQFIECARYFDALVGIQTPLEKSSINLLLAKTSDALALKLLKIGQMDFDKIDQCKKKCVETGISLFQNKQPIVQSEQSNQLFAKIFS